MNITKSFENQKNSSVKLTVTIPKEDVKAEYDAILARYTKNIVVPGFRKGHVPAKLLEQKYGENLKSDVAATLIDKSVNEIFEQEKAYAPLGYEQPKLTDEATLSFDNDFTYSIIYDVRPKIEINDLTGIAIKVPVVETGDSDVDEAIEELRLRNATVEAKDDNGVIEKGNIADVTFVELNASDDSEIANTKRENFVFTVGNAGENIYRFDDDIIGMKKGDTKIITKTYDQDADFQALKGKTIKMNVKINEVRVRNLPNVDDEFAQDVSEDYKTVADLKDAIRHNIETKRDEKLTEIKNSNIIEEIVKKNPIDLPQSMINVEVSFRLQEIAKQFRVDIKDIGKVFAIMGQDPKTALDNITESVINALKARLVIENLEKARNIDVTTEEIEARYNDIAQKNKITVDEVKAHYSKSASDRQYLIVDMKDNKLYDMLYKEVAITDGDKMKFSELIGQDAQDTI